MATNSKTTARARKKIRGGQHGPRQSSHGRAMPQPASRPKAAPPARRNASGKHGADPAAAMTTFAFYVNPNLALVCLPVAVPVLFSLETAAGLTGVHPEMLRYYCRLGLLGPFRVHREREPTFDQEALHEVRRIEHYRRHLAVSRQALPLVCELRREAERQHIEIHFLRYP